MTVARTWTVPVHCLAADCPRTDLATDWFLSVTTENGASMGAHPKTKLKFGVTRALWKRPSNLAAKIWWKLAGIQWVKLSTVAFWV
jgi:hypothetical protein